MTKTHNPILVFTLGFAFCAITLKALYGGPVISSPWTTDGKAKAAVLTALQTTSPPVQHFTGDSVVADAAAKLEPAIVEIHTVGKTVQVNPMAGSPFAEDPMFRQWFGNGDLQPQSVTPKGAGSGVIISGDGYVLTNDHVVAGAETLTVQVGDKGYTGKVIGTDPVSDIAVIKIQADKGTIFPVAQLGDSNTLRIGDWAIAIGDPLDIGTTVTLGIISALNRTGMEAENHQMQAVIQTDAAINPGNSGGALANINGQVIGINEAIASPTGYYSGIGFAIPINTAKKIAAQLIENGRVIYPYLGVQYGPLKALPQDARKELGIQIEGDNGVVVKQVYPGSPAAAAGLQVYDVILEANRQKLVDRSTLSDLVMRSKVGDTLTLLVSRNGQNQILTVTLKERPSTFGDDQPHAPDSERQQDDPGNPGDQ